MTPVPLDELGVSWRSHKSALWWLGLLYRKPRHFRSELEKLCRWRQLGAAFCVYLHQLPYLIVFCILGRWVLFGLVGLGTDPEVTQTTGEWLWHATTIAGGLLRGLTVGIAVWIVVGIFGGIIDGVVVGITLGIAGGMVFGIGGGITFGIFRSIAFGIAGGVGGGITVGLAGGIAGGIAVRILVGIAVGIAGGIAGGIVVGIAVGIAFGVGDLRAYYLCGHPLFIWPRARSTWYPHHPVAWDDLCSIPFPGLDRLLVAYSEENPSAGTREIDRLINSYPSQRHQALRAQVTLIARETALSRELSRLDETVARLPEGEKGFLRQTPRVREMVHEIAALQARLDTLDRPVLREPLARLLCREIESFQHRVAGFDQPLSREFRAAAERWLEIARQQLADARAVLEKEPTRQVFRAGDPVDREREAFVPRDSATGEIERQVMLATGCPGLVLYGRRRTGKSTVLRNLAGFLPPKVLRAGISMQDPTAFTSLGDLIGRLSASIRKAGVDAETLAADGADLRSLFHHLDAVDSHLEEKDRRLLLSIDEYENVDHKIGAGVFPEDLLATIRESIQVHRRITWIFAGSHEITELENAPWTSYLVSARTVEVPPFTGAETRLLLTEPLKYSTLWPKDDPTRPRFEPGFWGDGGIERIHAEAGGWPHLVQLIAETVVDLLNDDHRSEVDEEILDRALDKAIVRGQTVLYELIRRESTLPGEWDYLAGFRRRSTQPPPGDEAVDRSLRRRLLMVEEGGDYRLRVPLMERWLRQRG